MYWAIQLCLRYGLLSIFQLSLFCMAYFTVPPSNPVPLGTATLPGPLPISPPLSFNLTAAKTENALNWGWLTVGNSLG